MDWICDEWCREKVKVDQDWITFQGDGPRLTEIQWGDTANSAGSTFKSASVAVNGDHFTAKDISFRVILHTYLHTNILTY